MHSSLNRNSTPAKLAVKRFRCSSYVKKGMKSNLVLVCFTAMVGSTSRSNQASALLCLLLLICSMEFSLIQIFEEVVNMANAGTTREDFSTNKTSSMTSKQPPNIFMRINIRVRNNLPFKEVPTEVYSSELVSISVLISLVQPLHK